MTEIYIITSDNRASWCNINSIQQKKVSFFDEVQKVAIMCSYQSTNVASFVQILESHACFAYLRPGLSQPAALRLWRRFVGPWSDACVLTWRGSGWPSPCRSAVRHKHKRRRFSLEPTKNLIQSKIGATPPVRSSTCFKLHKHLKTTKGINVWGKFTTNKITAWLNGSRVALFLLLGLRSGIYPRGIQIGAIVLSQGIHLRAHGGCFQWAMLTSLSGDRKDPSLPGGGG